MPSKTEHIGVVKWSDDRKEYGHITRGDGRDVFVHHTGIKGDGFKTLTDGDPVSFDIEKGAVDLRQLM